MRKTCRLSLTLTLVLFLIPSFLCAGEHFFDSGGVEIRYLDQGEGEPVVLIHGFTATAESNWGAGGLLESLSGQYRVLAIDNRGHGKSGKPHGVKHYGAEMVKDVLRLLDHLDIEKAHVAGYSMGGFMTLNLIATAPERVASAVLGGAGWSPPGEGGELRTLLADSLEQGKGIGPLIDFLTPEGQPRMTQEQKDGINAMLTANNDTMALASVIRAMGGLDVSEAQVKDIQVPTLAIIGANDPLKSGVDALKLVLPSLEVVVVEGADHMTAFGRPEFRQALLDFLAKNSMAHDSAAGAETTAAANF